MFLSLNIVCKRNLNIFFIFCTKSTDFAIGIRTPIEYVENPIYYKTNNIYSLALAKDWLCSDDTLIFESDLIFEDEVIDLLLEILRCTRSAPRCAGLRRYSTDCSNEKGCCDLEYQFLR